MQYSEKDYLTKSESFRFFCLSYLIDYTLGIVVCQGKLTRKGCKVFGKICTENLSERSPNRDLSGIGQNHVNWPRTMNMSVNAKNFTHPPETSAVIQR